MQWLNILCTLLIYKDEGGSCDGGFWQALTKVILDFYINNFHDKLLYMYYGQINHSDSDSDFLDR